VILSLHIGRSESIVYRLHTEARCPVKSLVKLCSVAVAALSICALAWGGPTPEQLYRDAQKAERAGETVRAYLLYAEAAAADPANIKYWERAQALRPLASLQKDALPSKSELPADPIDKTLFGTITPEEFEQARKPLPPPQLKAVPGRQDFDLKADAKTLWEKVGEAFHLMVLFDSDYRSTGTVHFQMSGVDYKEALHGLEFATNSFVTTVGERIIFIANDTTQKRTQFENTATVIIPFRESTTVQEAQEVFAAVRGLFDMRRFMVDSNHHAVLIRDHVTKVRLAEMLLLDLMRAKPQVAIEVEVLAVDKSSTIGYGLTLPTAFPLVAFPNRSNLLTSIPSSASTFLTFGGGASLIGIGLTSASLFGNIAKSSATSLMRSEIVALDGQPSTLHVGDKYPIVTNGYFGQTTGSGTVFTPPPTFNFEDLGLILKVTPHVHGMDEVSLDVDAEVKLLGSGSVDGIPVISNRKYESKIRVMEGQWAVLAGLMSSTDARTITGIAGLTSIPFLRSNAKNRDNSETLIILKPHLLNLPPTEFPTWRAYSGSETKTPSLF